MNCAHCDTPIPENSKFCLACGADLSDPGGGPRTTRTADGLPGRLARALEGRYEVTKMVGRGGMGAVFLAEDLTLERPVAIKVLPPDVSEDENLIGRFEREARTAAKLDHPNIIPIFAVEAVDDLHFFVMKFVSGKSFDDLLRESRLEIEQAQNYLWEAALALGHAHRRGVVHRDIKPANIMLDHDGRLMLADFGISKAMQSKTQHTSTGQVIGTPHYMSPEQAKGLSVDGRCDQYSLGVVGYQLLTGRLPFADDSVHTVIYKHIFEDPQPIRELNSDVPPYLATAVHRAMAKEPDDRFPTMEDFAQAVCPDRRVSQSSSQLTPSRSRLAADAPTEITTTPTTLSRSVIGTPKRRRRTPVVLTLLVILVGGGGGGYLAWSQGMLDGVLGGSGTLLGSSGEDPGFGEPSLMAGDTTGGAVASPDSGTAGTADTVTAGATVDNTPVPEPEPPPIQRPVTPPTNRGGASTSVPVRQPERPRLGSIRVSAEPYGNVFVDDVFIGESPIANHAIEAGRHIVRIRRDNCRDYVDTVSVNIGQRANVWAVLTCGS